jgi:DNA primase
MQTVFDTIKDRLPITEVLATYITLTPAGSQFKSKCPFHNERSASFSVSPERGLYYCFGCGAKGDIFTFVEQFEGVDRKGALKILADRAGVVLTHDHIERENTDTLYDILESTTSRYQEELARTPGALEYIASRGILPATIASFRIGYAPDQWRFVANAMTSDASAAIAVRAGLIKKTEKPGQGQSIGAQYYDRFRTRVMFPLSDASGRVVGFSGRLWPVDQGSDSQSPKYLNSPETELFQKSRILFGFDKAKASIRQHNFVILVEGQIDCVLAHQAGFKNTVATSGTAVSDAAAADPTANLVVLARLTPNIFLAFDGDAAGQKALDHAAIVALGLGMNPKVVPLPPGIDPAEYIQQHGAEGWKNLLKESQHFILHQLRSIKSYELSAHVLVQTIKERVFPFLVRVASPLEQGRYVEAIAKELDIPASDIVRELNLFSSTTQSEKVSVASVAPVVDVISNEERFVALVQLFPTEKALLLKENIASLSYEQYQFSFQPIAEHKMTELLALAEREYGYLSEERREALLVECSQKIEEQFYTRIRQEYSRALAQSVKDNDETQEQSLMVKLQGLNQRRHGQS